MRVVNICRNYFTPLATMDARDQPFVHRKSITALKIASYVIPLFPAFFGMLYGIAKWIQHCKKVEKIVPNLVSSSTSELTEELSFEEVTAVEVREPLNKIKVLLFAVFKVQRDIDTIRKEIGIPDFPKDLNACRSKILGVLNNFQVLTRRIFGEKPLYFGTNIVEFEVGHLTGEKAKNRMLKHILSGNSCDSYHMDFRLLAEDILKYPEGIKIKQKNLKLTLYPKGDNPYLKLELISLYIFQVFRRHMEAEDILQFLQNKAHLNLIYQHLDSLHRFVYPKGFSYEVAVSYACIDPESGDSESVCGAEKTSMIKHILSGNAYNEKDWARTEDDSGNVTLIFRMPEG